MLLLYYIVHFACHGTKQNVQTRWRTQFQDYSSIRTEFDIWLLTMLCKINISLQVRNLCGCQSASLVYLPGIMCNNSVTLTFNLLTVYILAMRYLVGVMLPHFVPGLYDLQLWPEMISQVTTTVDILWTKLALFRPPGTLVPGRPYVLLQMFFFLSPRNRAPSADCRETLPHIAIWTIFIMQVQKFGGPPP